ncbi:hypothetical protein KIH87_12710 [Paraneptunicella aestuarii]|uniref:hypothetical protein n=1 Tax=Paraneptunicella aestuarii TaxID=2831148 RepID=UPI001E2C84F2|nr:hypothetical protein [Paraneptunicella aestuarii]UAA37570.1 hypothetical protein KIH87_12710 [Paraneptunicella aestuarii]
MKYQKRYKLTEVNLPEAIKKVAFPFSLCLGLLAYSVNKGGDWEFHFFFGSSALLCLLVAVKALWQGRTLFITTDQYGLTFAKSNKQYSWSSLKRIEFMKVQLQVMAAPHPGFILHFDNGDKRIIDQRLKGYTDFYQELYQRNIPGANKPLYLYEVDITGSNKSMSRKYHSVYYPDKDIVVKESGIATYD